MLSRSTKRPQPTTHIQDTIGLHEILKSPFSFEFVVLLYVYSGLYKEISILSGIFPIDPTIILALAISLWLPIIIVRRKTMLGCAQIRSFFFMAALIGYASLSLFWTPSVDYALSKMLYLVFVSMLAFLATITIATDMQRLRNLLLANIFLSLIILFALTAFVISSEVARTAIMSGERFYIFGLQGAYQVISRVFAFAIMSFVIGFWYFRGTSLAWIVLTPVLLLEFFFMLTTGGRGGLFGLFIAAVILGGFSFTRFMRGGLHVSPTKTLLAAVLIVGGAVYLSYVLANGNLPTTLARLLESDALPNMYRYGYRAHLLLQIPELWSESPVFGSGLGSYPILIGHGDSPQYPHNVVAEILVELGIVGLLLYISFLGWAIRSWWLERNQVPPFLWLFAITALAFGLGMASVGSDLTSSRFIWMTYGLIFVRDSVAEKKKRVGNE